MPHGVLCSREVRSLLPGINSFSSLGLGEIYCLCKGNKIVFMLSLCVAKERDNNREKGGKDGQGVEVKIERRKSEENKERWWAGRL